MKKSQPAGRQGFTLVELLIYIGLLSILLTILTRIFTGITDVQLSSESTGAVEEDSRYIYSRLSYDLGRTASVVTPANPGDQSNTLTLLIDGVATTYGINNANLVIGTDQLNSVGTKVTNLLFRRLGNSVQASFTITSTTENVRGPDTKNMETTIALR